MLLKISQPGTGKLIEYDLQRKTQSQTPTLSQLICQGNISQNENDFSVNLDNSERPGKQHEPLEDILVSLCHTRINGDVGTQVVG